MRGDRIPDKALTKVTGAGWGSLAQVALLLVVAGWCVAFAVNATLSAGSHHFAEFVGAVSVVLIVRCLRFALLAGHGLIRVRGVAWTRTFDADGCVLSVEGRRNRSATVYRVSLQDRRGRTHDLGVGCYREKSARAIADETLEAAHRGVATPAEPPSSAVRVRPGPAVTPPGRPVIPPGRVVPPDGLDRTPTARATVTEEAPGA